MNMNKIAKEVASMEGKEKQVNIAQIKETIKCLMLVLSKYDDEAISAKLEWYARKYNTVTGEPRLSPIKKLLNKIW